MTSAQPDDWVVTYTIEDQFGIFVTEFYRGEMEECVRIRAHSGGGDDDRRSTNRPWKPTIGPAREWDQLVEQC